MLKIKAEAPFRTSSSATPETPFDVLAFVRLVRRQSLVIAAVVAGCLVAGLCYAAFASPRYTASTFIMVDTHRNAWLQGPNRAEAPLDAGIVESQVEILKSDGVALSVIRDLKLTEDPRFVGNSHSFFGSIAGWWSPSTPDQLERRALDLLSRSVAVKRVGLTYVIQVSVTAAHGAQAAAIANAVADAYMVGEWQAHYDATKRASRWLQDRIMDLREQAVSSDRDVQVFKSANDLVETGRGLMSEQQLSDANQQIMAARAATAETKARLDRIQHIAQSDLPDATVGDALHSDVINRLRAQYLDLVAKEADWAARYGASHAAVVALRNQAREIKRSMVDELGRIAETYKSDYEIAKARETSIQGSLSSLVNQASTTGQAHVKLRDLESTAQTYRNLYDSFLQRFTEATQQQTVPPTEARVITPASEPTAKSWPRIPEILAGAGAIGALLGLVAAFGREQLDPVFRTPAQIEDATALDCLGVLPLVSWEKPAEPLRVRYSVANGRRVPFDIGLSRHVVTAPFSRFAETLRSVKVAADVAGLTRETRVIGVVSAVPHEGKTMAIANLAQLVAGARKRVLLIDADLRNPELTRSITPDAQHGLIEVLTGRRSEDDTVWTDPFTGLHILPAVLNGRVAQTAEFLTSSAMAHLLARIRERYDYVFLDLPPALPVVDVRAAGHLIDAFVLVVEWGRTTKDAVADMLSANNIVRERALGVVLNKADPAMLKRIEAYKGEAYGSYYASATPYPASPSGS